MVSHRRSIQLQEEVLYIYNVNKRPEPYCENNAIDLLTNIDMDISKYAKNTDFAWLLTRQMTNDNINENQITPG